MYLIIIDLLEKWPWTGVDNELRILRQATAKSLPSKQGRPPWPVGLGRSLSAGVADILPHLDPLCVSCVASPKEKHWLFRGIQRQILLRNSPTTNWGFTYHKKKPTAAQTVILTETIPKSNDPSNHCLPLITPGPKPCRIEMMNNMFTATSSVSLLQGKKSQTGPWDLLSLQQQANWKAGLVLWQGRSTLSTPSIPQKVARIPFFYLCFLQGILKIFKVAMKMLCNQYPNYVM